MRALRSYRMAQVAFEKGFEGGHGSHWDAVLEDPGRLAEVLKAAFREGREGPWAPAVGGVERARVRERVLPLGKAGLEAMVLELDLPAKGKPAVATIYPHLRVAGAPLPFTPTRIIEWSGGLEAEVAGSLGDEAAEVAFFATDYHQTSAEYREGERLNVAFSVVSYTLGIISPEPRFEEIDGRKVDVSKAAIVAPLKDSERAPYYDDDFFIQGPASRVELFEYPPWDEGVVVWLDAGNLGELPVAGRRKHFPHGVPRKGDFVASYSWLQGRIG